MKASIEQSLYINLAGDHQQFHSRDRFIQNIVDIYYVRQEMLRITII